MSKLLIIKLGGSIITDKNSPTPKPNQTKINALSKKVSTFYNEGNQIILVHGAGSFGHPIVKKYHLQKGMKTPEQKHAFKETQRSMNKLNNIIVKSLHKLKLPATTFVPHSFIKQSSGELIPFDVKLIKERLTAEKIPVLYGDAVEDIKIGCSVLSGDTIVTYLANKLKADRVIFFSDVEGVFDKDPKRYPDAKLIKEVTDKNLKTILKGLSSSDRADVTGEMKGKILQIKNSLLGVEVFIGKTRLKF